MIKGRMHPSTQIINRLKRKIIEEARSVLIARALSMKLPKNLIPFLVISMPRSGSNLFCSLLNSHPQILCFYEMFHKEAIHYGPYNYENYDFGSMEERDRDPMAFLLKTFSAVHGFKAVGIKMFNNHNNVVLRGMIRTRKVKKIILRRKAALHAFTSLMMARRNREYILLNNKESKNQKKSNIQINVDSFKTYVASMDRYYRQIQKQVGRQVHADLDYVDVANNTAKFKSVFSFLSVDDSERLEAVTKKQNYKRLEERIINFDEVVQSLTGTKYAKYLTEELE